MCKEEGYDQACRDVIDALDELDMDEIVWALDKKMPLGLIPTEGEK